uniref:Uncharacterized protein n=1 Tax=Panagrolaimus sp. ES5 TaxID=591445 RepID=A0AC34GEL2_9BILA
LAEGVKHLQRRSLRTQRIENNIDNVLDISDDPDTSDCHYERKNEVFKPEDLTQAHFGLFKDIPWTKEERLLISDYHATQQYHLLGPLLKKKLNEMNAGLPYKHEVTNFFVKNYPPKEVRQLHDNDSKCRIREAMANENPEIQQALQITFESLKNKSPDAQKTIQNYIISNSQQREESNKEEEIII